MNETTPPPQSSGGARRLTRKRRPLVVCCGSGCNTYLLELEQPQILKPPPMDRAWWRRRDWYCYVDGVRWVRVRVHAWTKTNSARPAPPGTGYMCYRISVARAPEVRTRCGGREVYGKRGIVAARSASNARLRTQRGSMDEDIGICSSCVGRMWPDSNSRLCPAILPQRHGRCCKSTAQHSFVSETANGSGRAPQCGD